MASTGVNHYGGWISRGAPPPISADFLLRATLSKGQDNAINSAAPSLEEERTNVVPDAIRANWVLYQRAELNSGFIKRLEMLAHLPNGWRGKGSRKLAPNSLRTFLLLWEQINHVAREPFPVLTPNGRLFLEWHSSWKRHLDIECLDDDQIVFGLIDNETNVSGKLAVEGANASISALSLRAFRWSGFA